MSRWSAEVVGGWTVVATVDEDGHLTLSVSHSDESGVVEGAEEIDLGEGVWAERFTTNSIEAAYAAGVDAE